MLPTIASTSWRRRRRHGRHREPLPSPACPARPFSARPGRPSPTAFWASPASAGRRSPRSARQCPPTWTRSSTLWLSTWWRSMARRGSRRRCLRLKRRSASCSTCAATRRSTRSSPCAVRGMRKARSRRSSGPSARPRASRCTPRSGRWSMTSRDFWKSAGMHLLERGPEGWLAVTPAFLRAYYTRPEMHPLDESCEAEVRLHEELMADPLRPVEAARLTALADAEAAHNYRLVLAYRDLLMQAGTIEGAYLRLMRRASVPIPSVFIDQMVHLILRNILADCADPMRLRAAELFFREQSVSTDDNRLMLADEEIVEMHARAGRETGLGQLLAETGTPMKSVTLDVLDEEDKEIYWARSDRFDTVIDFRFGQPALDAFARVIESWLRHLLKIDAQVEPRPSIEDADWR